MICYLCCISHLLPYTHHVIIQISNTLLDVFSVNMSTTHPVTMDTHNYKYVNNTSCNRGYTTDNVKRKILFTCKYVNNTSCNHGYTQL
jgi:hypothetical protein